MGVELMLANRVHRGGSVQPPRFRWVPYVDALMFPLDNSQLAQENSDRKAFFADEEQVRAQFLREAGFDAPPRALYEKLPSRVTPAPPSPKLSGAGAEKI